jgi:hypothetical protein
VLMLVNHEANARRIARVPLLEAEVLRLTEANAALAEELARMRAALQRVLDHVEDGSLERVGGQCTLCYTERAAIRAALSHTGMTGQREGV